MGDNSGRRTILERYRTVRATDRAVTRGSLEDIFGEHHFDIVDGDYADIRIHSCQLSSVTLSYLSLGAGAHVALGNARSCYLVQVPLAGSARAYVRDECLVVKSTRAAVLPPDELVDMWFSADCRLLVVRLNQNSMETHTRSLLHSPLGRPLRFELAMDVASGAARDWHESLMSLIRLADSHEGILHHPLAVADVERALMTGLLVAQPNTYSHLLHAHTSDEVRTPTETVIALIDMHPEREYTVVGLANMVGVSVRTLEKQFRQQVGLPPSSYLRQVRLERVREELTVMPGVDKKVSEVAARWGIYHFGRFAGEYFKKYHEMPSETVRRNRSSRIT
jgi:AraC-like DNA-binding protein